MISGSDETARADDSVEPPEDDAAPALDPFEEDRPSGAFVVDLDGFEGPLDLLLSLAREHKLDLTKISILALAQQYLAFIAEIRRLRLEVAADYLVMAAWLAFLKSKLLLPEDEEGDEPTGAELAAQLAFRLKRLEAMRDAAATLMTGKRLGQDFFARGMPEGIRLVRSSAYDANVYDLLSAYSQQRQRTAVSSITFEARPVWSIKEGRARLEQLLGMSCDWAPINDLLVQFLIEPEQRRTAVASTFGASLELAREGKVDLRQAEAFAPLYVRKRADGTT
ncbi:MAG: segregation/condensation protein A [Hyphomicrobiales bacterium]|nr:segregation/condensation protein A [Hyphomicrobiales bacterium]